MIVGVLCTHLEAFSTGLWATGSDKSIARAALDVADFAVSRFLAHLGIAIPTA